MNVSHFRRIRHEENFRWRGGEITRVEAFSDAVFAFAVTLLVVSLEVPKTWRELAVVMKGFGAFAICFTFLVMVWNEHRRFFRRYGLEDAYTIFLNSALLFVSLFYVYPLKFLFSFLVGEMTNGATLDPSMAHNTIIYAAEVPAMMITYGLGFAAVYLIFSLLYLHAFRLRGALELDPIEVFLTKRSLLNNSVLMGFGLASAALAAMLGPAAGLAGYLYMFIGVYFGIAESMMGRHERRLVEARDRRLNSIKLEPAQHSSETPTATQ